MWLLTTSLQDGRLTLREILSDIPHDVPAMVVYALLALFMGFIWWGSRDRDGVAGGRGDGDTPAAQLPERRSR